MIFNSKFKINKKEISFNSPTYFIADIAANHDGNFDRVKKLVYLAKDSLMKPHHFKKMYINKLNKFLDCKLKYDPNQFFQSNMYRRLFLGRNK